MADVDNLATIVTRVVEELGVDDLNTRLTDAVECLCSKEETVQSLLEQVGEKQQACSAFISKYQDRLAELKEKMDTKIDDVDNYIEQFQEGSQNIGETLNDIGNEGNEKVNALMAPFYNVHATVNGAIENAEYFINDELGYTASTTQNRLMAQVNGAKTYLFDTFIPNLEEMLTTLASRIEAVIGKLMDLFQQLGSRLKQFGENIIDDLKTQFKELFSGILDRINQLVRTVERFIALIDDIMNVMNTTKDTMNTSVKMTGSGIQIAIGVIEDVKASIMVALPML